MGSTSHRLCEGTETRRHIDWPIFYPIQAASLATLRLFILFPHNHRHHIPANHGQVTQPPPHTHKDA